MTTTIYFRISLTAKDLGSRPQDQDFTPQWLITEAKTNHLAKGEKEVKQRTTYPRNRIPAVTRG